MAKLIAENIRQNKIKQESANDNEAVSNSRRKNSNP